MTQKKIEPPYSWDLQENLLLKTGNIYTADYSYGFELIELAEGFYERVPKYWRNNSGQLISNKQFRKNNLQPTGDALTSYKFEIVDFSTL